MPVRPRGTVKCARLNSRLHAVDARRTRADLPFLLGIDDEREEARLKRLELPTPMGPQFLDWRAGAKHARIQPAKDRMLAAHVSQIAAFIHIVGGGDAHSRRPSDRPQ